MLIELSCLITIRESIARSLSGVKGFQIHNPTFNCWHASRQPFLQPIQVNNIICVHRDVIFFHVPEKHIFSQCSPMWKRIGLSSSRFCSNWAQRFWLRWTCWWFEFRWTQSAKITTVMQEFADFYGLCFN